MSNNETARTRADELKQTLEREKELLDYFVDEEEKLRLFVNRKDWIGVDSVLRELQGLSDDIAAREQERVEVYEDFCRAVGRSPEESFYRITAELDSPALRGVLNSLYRNIKVSLLRLQGVTTGLGQFVADKEKTIQDILGEVVPQSRGKTYGRDGFSRRGTGQEVKVLNRRL